MRRSRALVAAVAIALSVVAMSACTPRRSADTALSPTAPATSATQSGSAAGTVALPTAPGGPAYVPGTSAGNGGAAPAGSAKSGATGSKAASAPNPALPRNGVMFGFITAAISDGHGGAMATLDPAEMHPTDESAPPGSANEISNPTVESIPFIAPAAAKVVRKPGSGPVSVATWLAERTADQSPQAVLVSSPYWIEFKNGAVVKITLQQVP